MAKNVYIVNGARTPMGSFLGSLSSVTAPELGAVAIKAALERAGINPDQPDEVLMGCVLPAGIGQAPARQAMRKAGMPDAVGAVTLNKVCGSGMKTMMVGRSEILAGEADMIVAGGMESMSQAPHLLKGTRNGYKMGNQQLIDAMIHDGLWDPYGNVHMGNCAERCAEKYGFSQADQDNYAIESYKRALQSLEDNVFADEIAPVEVPQRKGDPLVINQDEEPGRGNIEKLPKLRPVFEKEGSITAGNASTINDGAAAVVLASEDAVKEYNLTPMARIISVGTHSQDPTWFTTAPIGAMEIALKKAELTASDMDVFEINEAFSAVAMAAIKDLALDHGKVNIRGGAVALGHPIGCSGTRLIVTLMHTLKQTNQRYGLASLCIGGGEATAMVIENMQYTS